MVERKECVVLGNRFRLAEHPCLPSPCYAFHLYIHSTFRQTVTVYEPWPGPVPRMGLWMGTGGADPAPHPWSLSSEAVEEVK